MTVRKKIPKIRPFYNLESAKISKKCEKYYQHQFWKIHQVKEEIKRIYFTYIFFCFLKMLLSGCILSSDKTLQDKKDEGRKMLKSIT